MKAQVAQQDIASLGTTAAILLAMNVKAVQMLATPSKHNVQDRMEVRQGCIAPDKDTAPDE